MGCVMTSLGPPPRYLREVQLRNPVVFEFCKELETTECSIVSFIHEIILIAPSLDISLNAYLNEIIGSCAPHRPMRGVMMMR